MIPFMCFYRNSSSGDHEVDFEMEFWSDISDNSEKLSRSISNNSVSVDSCFESEASRDRLGYLYFQYSETCSPFWRIPFSDKVHTSNCCSNYSYNFIFNYKIYYFWSCLINSLQATFNPIFDKIVKIMKL